MRWKVWTTVLVAIAVASVACSSDGDGRSVVAFKVSPPRPATTVATPTTTSEAPTTTALPPLTTPTTTIVAPPPAPPPATAPAPRPPSGVPTSIDLNAFGALVASVPELQPSDPTPGCEQLELLSLDLVTRSLTAFQSFSGSSPCPGDPMETYVEVNHGVVTEMLRCAELDQTGECARFNQVRSRSRGRQVTVVDIRQCGAGVCAGPVRTRIRD